MKRMFVVALGSMIMGASSGVAVAAAEEGKELPTKAILFEGSGAEAYFSPNGKRLIFQGKLPTDAGYHVYTIRTDGKDARRLNDQGVDACSYYFPDGKHVVWTSTKDHPELPPGSFSDPTDYPQGAELYVSDLDGAHVRRLTDNGYYDAEVSLSPDGQWILFTRQIDGKLDLWRMRPDGSDEFQITKTDDWQEGGSFYLPDSETILYRAWKKEDDAKKSRPMSLFTIRHDGTGFKPIINDGGTNWSPYPAPDGRHFVFVKVLPPHNFEIFLGDLQSEGGDLRRLTYSDAFDGFPTLSPDGDWLVFSSSRDVPGRKVPEGQRWLSLILMDVSSLNIGPPK